MPLDYAFSAAKAVIVAEAERLHWRIWNGKAQNAQKSIDRIRTVMHQFQGEQGGRKPGAPSRKLWTTLQVRCAVYNGTFGSAYGRKFQPANDSSPPMAIAA